MSFTAKSTYGKYKHKHGHGTLGLLMTGTQNKYLDFKEALYGGEQYATNRRLELLSINKTDAVHNAIIPLNGTTDESNDLMPCITVFLWERIN